MKQVNVGPSHRWWIDHEKRDTQVVVLDDKGVPVAQFFGHQAKINAGKFVDGLNTVRLITLEVGDEFCRINSEQDEILCTVTEQMTGYTLYRPAGRTFPIEINNRVLVKRK